MVLPKGSSTSGEFYAEAIETLKARYNRPRLIHQSHVRMILDAPGLKEGTGREIRRLHNTVQQHLRALKAMECEPSGPFITSILELKLDPNTNFEWQKFSQEVPGYPHYGKLLDFLNLRAQASESSANDVKKNLTRIDDRSKKGVNRQITSFATNTSNLSSTNCSLCKTGKHSLFTCPQFKVLSHQQKMSAVKSNELCINCLRPGHFMKQCRSANRCHSISFVSERVAQALRLTRSRRDAKIHGVAGISHDSHTQSFTSIVVSPLQDSSKEINVSAVIVPRVTCDLPSQHIPFKVEWNHLSDLTLADPDFGQPGKIDILLGVEVFSEVVRQGRRSGKPGSPSAFETDFGWVLAGETRTHVSYLSLLTHHTTVDTGDGLLRKFWEIEEQQSILVSLLRNDLLCSISKITTPVIVMVDSSFLYPRNLRQGL